MVAAALAASVAPAGATTAAPVRPAQGASGIATFRYTQEDTGTIEPGATIEELGSFALVGDFAGDDSPVGNLDDIFWFTGGPGIDTLVRTEGDRTTTVVSTHRVNGHYSPIVGSFAGDDGKDDIFWYAPGPAPDYLWDFEGDGTFTERRYQVNGTYDPVVMEVTADGASDIIWYAPGTRPDAWWDFDASGHFTDRPVRIDGHYRPVVGTFRSNAPGTAYDNIIWYAPGPATDWWWEFSSTQYWSHPLRIDGDYTPIAGDFTGDDYEDVLWYGIADRPDHLWDIGPYRQWEDVAVNVGGVYTPFVGTFFAEDGPRVDDIVWYGHGPAPDYLWDHHPGGGRTSMPITLDGFSDPGIGSFAIVDDAGTPRTGLDLLDRNP